MLSDIHQAFGFVLLPLHEGGLALTDTQTQSSQALTCNRDIQ